jgi:hypothetical protein
MFIIRCSSDNAFADAGFILRHYETYNTFVPGNSWPIVIKVELSKELPDEEAQQQLMLCEMAFEMNWVQDNERLCLACKEAIERTGEGSDCCGHLTFARPIQANVCFPKTQDIGGANG